MADIKRTLGETPIVNTFANLFYKSFESFEERVKWRKILKNKSKKERQEMCDYYFIFHWMNDVHICVPELNPSLEFYYPPK